MNKNRISIFLLALFAIITVHAAERSESNDRAKANIVFDVTGPVKSISLKSENLLAQMFKKIKFNKEGKVKKLSFLYSPDGYPIGNGNSIGEVRTYTYLFPDKTKEILDSAIYVSFYNGDKLTTKISNTFQDKILKERSYQSAKGDDKRNTSFVFFSIEKTDDYGNWTRRKVTQTTVRNDGQPEVTEYIETRKITYYK